MPDHANDAAPMYEHELGRYVCVHNCLHSPLITIRSNGVWVKQGPGIASSAHRDCYLAWRLREGK